MKSLEKDRTHRYETVNGLVADVRRHLSNEPVSAAAPTASYQLKKFYRRHHSRIQIAAIVMVLLTVAGVFSSWQAYRAAIAEKVARDKQQLAMKQAELAVEAKAVADQAKELARQREYDAKVGELTAVQERGLSGYRSEVFEMIGEVLALGGEKADLPKLRNVAVATLMDPLSVERENLEYPLPDKQDVRVFRVFGDRIAFGYTTGIVRVFHLFEGSLIAELGAETGDAVTDVLYRADVDSLLVAHRSREVVAWRLQEENGRPVVLERHRFGELPGDPFLVECGDLAMICAEQSDKTWLWTPTLGLPELMELPVPLLQRHLDLEIANKPGRELVAGSPDGRWLAILLDVVRVMVWDRRTGDEITVLNSGGSMHDLGHFLTFSPKGDYFVFETVGDDRPDIFSTADWKHLPFAAVHYRRDSIGDDFYIAGGVSNEKISLETGELIEVLPWLGGYAHVAEDGETVFSVRVRHDEETWKAFREFDTAESVVTDHKVGTFAIEGASFSPDNRWLVVASEQPDQPLSLWRSDDWKRVPLEQPAERSRTRSPSFSRDGRWMASSYRRLKKIVIWDTSSWRIVKELSAPLLAFDVWFHPSANLLVSGGSDKVMCWEYEEPEQSKHRELHFTPKFEVPASGWVFNARLSEDLNYLAWWSKDGSGTTHVVRVDKDGFSPCLEEKKTWAYALLDGGAVLLNRQPAATCEIRRLEDGRLVSEPDFSSFAMTQNVSGSLIASKFRFNAERKYGIRIFDVERNLTLAEFESPTKNYSGPTAWSPDGTYLLDPMYDGRVRIIDIAKLRSQLDRLGLDWED